MLFAAAWLMFPKIPLTNVAHRCAAYASWEIAVLEGSAEGVSPSDWGLGQHYRSAEQG